VQQPASSTESPAAVTQGLPAATEARTLVSPKARRYTIVDSGQFDEDEEHDQPPSPAAARAAGSENFAGTARKRAKTSIADADEAEFASVLDLVASLPSDASMIDRDPEISSSATSDRVEEEQLNVTVDGFLYAASREDDNDYHLIIGDNIPRPQREYMNVEVSGLPASGPFREPLKESRQQFKDFFGSDLPGGSYDFYTPPIPVRISGSLFYDIDHRPGAVGPGSHKPRTAWEIHPITAIEFEPE
jgi:hypothetical protein